MQRSETTGLATLAAASLVSMALGSIHAFSIFVAPMEAMFDAPRASVSLTYSFALIALTTAVLLGPNLYSRVSAGRYFVLVSCLAATGLFLAGLAQTLAVVWIGYGLIFGTANGLGYGYGLQIVAQSNPGKEGFNMGVVTAAYALGAVISPAILHFILAGGSLFWAMSSIGLCLVLIGFVAAFLLKGRDIRFQQNPRTARDLPPRKIQWLLWTGYFGGVVAGLMIIGHAAGILAVSDPALPMWVSPVIVASCNLLGSLLAGKLADIFSPRRVLLALAGLTALALAWLIVGRSNGGVLMGLGLIGFSYGGTIAVYPAAIAKLFGLASSARIYGRVFTAWGTAGLAGPWMAGLLYDRSGTYGTALLAALAMACVSVAVSMILPADRWQQKAN